jgi:hypothetical protein
MNTYAILSRNAWNSVGELEKAAGASSRVGQIDFPRRVRWIRSYVLREGDGRFGLICIFQSPSVDLLREYARRSAIPANEIVPIGSTIVLYDDPLPSV